MGSSNTCDLKLPSPCTAHRTENSPCWRLPAAPAPPSAPSLQDVALGWEPALGFCDTGVSVTWDFQCPHQPGCSPHLGLSLSRLLPGEAQPAGTRPSSRFFLPLLEPSLEPSLEHAFGGVSPRYTPLTEPPPTLWGGAQIPMKNSCGAEAWDSAPAHSKLTWRLDFPSKHCQGDIRTSVPRTSERPCTSNPWPCPPGSLRLLAGSYLPRLCARKMTAAGWGLDWTQTEVIRGRECRRKTGFPSPVPACPAWLD